MNAKQWYQRSTWGGIIVVTMLTVSVFTILLTLIGAITCDPYCGPIEANDVDRIQFALNLEYLEAEFFLKASTGFGLDFYDPTLAQGGPPPIGARKANLDLSTNRVIEEFGYQEIGHLRAIIRQFGGIGGRPLYNLSVETFAETVNNAVGYKLNPPFDPYANTTNYLIAAYMIPHVGQNGYVGAIPFLSNFTSKQLVASLLAIETGQDAYIRTRLSEMGSDIVEPYAITVADFTNRISALRNRLGMCGIKDEGIIVPLLLGAENRTTSNVLSADPNSLGYARTPQEILRIVYGTGCENCSGGFLPQGGKGRIAEMFLGSNSTC